MGSGSGIFYHRFDSDCRVYFPAKRGDYRIKQPEFVLGKQQYSDDVCSKRYSTTAVLEPEVRSNPVPEVFS